MANGAVQVGRRSDVATRWYSDAAGSCREGVVVILHIHPESETELLHIGKTRRLPRLFPRLGKDGKENSQGWQ